jgi:hypothetical protein
MGELCNTHGKARKVSENLKRECHWEDLGVGGRIILEWISSSYPMGTRAPSRV